VRLHSSCVFLTSRSCGVTELLSSRPFSGTHMTLPYLEFHVPFVLAQAAHNMIGSWMAAALTNKEWLLGRLGCRLSHSSYLAVSQVSGGGRSATAWRQCFPKAMRPPVTRRMTPSRTRPGTRSTCCSRPTTLPRLSWIGREVALQRVRCHRSSNAKDPSRRPQQVSASVTCRRPPGSAAPAPARRLV
jgi:hypothetical protein